jgi:transposase
MAEKLSISEEQRTVLERWVKGASTPQAVARRARILLMAATGASNSEIARTVGVSRPTVIAWREEFAKSGVRRLTETGAGRGRRPQHSEAKVRQIVAATLQTKPKGATHWSCRTMAEAQGVSPATVQRIWDAHGLQPHRTKTFKLSRDPRFIAKLTDVVGLYLNPPDRAVVLCVDEKSQIQALDRTQPGLPMKKGRCGTVTHDYKRHGTTSLFAALNVLDGRVIGECHQRHRHQEFLKFLRRLDREFPRKLTLHLILDNYGTHTHPTVQEWLTRHPRFELHFTPTSSSWLNLVERWFRDLTQKQIRRGAFQSVPDLKGAIREYLAETNRHPKPFIWTATVESILKKLRRCKAIFETLH